MAERFVSAAKPELSVVRVEAAEEGARVPPGLRIVRELYLP